LTGQPSRMRTSAPAHLRHDPIAGCAVVPM
jgi:hypothetical protein